MSPITFVVLFLVLVGAVAYADQPIAPRKIADGVVATWSPR